APCRLRGALSSAPRAASQGRHARQRGMVERMGSTDDEAREPRPFPEPCSELNQPRAALCAFLDFHRDRVLHKLVGLGDQDLRRGVLPSGWSALELVHHLTHVERRWLQWGFLGEPVDDPFGDTDAAGRWRVAPADTADDVLRRYRATCARSRAIVAGAALDQVSRVGGRFGPGDGRPALSWILVHLVQEYARHVGHLDAVRELLDGRVGE
ncbi:MAG: DinB family protein, partial [Trebonia sp.]